MLRDAAAAGIVVSMRSVCPETVVNVGVAVVVSVVVVILNVVAKVREVNSERVLTTS